MMCHARMKVMVECLEEHLPSEDPTDIEDEQLALLSAVVKVVVDELKGELNVTEVLWEEECGVHTGTVSYKGRDLEIGVIRRTLDGYSWYVIDKKDDFYVWQVSSFIQDIDYVQRLCEEFAEHYLVAKSKEDEDDKDE